MTEAQRRANAKWNDANRHRQRWYKLASRYGVNEVWYVATWLEQNGLCPICDGPLPDPRTTDERLAPVDHNHRTGEARAILCNACNIMLAGLESPLRRRADEYLARHV